MILRWMQTLVLHCLRPFIGRERVLSIWRAQQIERYLERVDRRELTMVKLAGALSRGEIPEARFDWWFRHLAEQTRKDAVRMDPILRASGMDVDHPLFAIGRKSADPMPPRGTDK
jgi:hypothetical protein